MKRFLIRWVLGALLLFVTARYVPGIHITWYGAVMAAVVLGFLGAVVRPILVLLTIPLEMATFGLFVLVVNGALFLGTAWLVPGFGVSNILAAIAGAFVYGVLGAVAHVVTSIGENPLTQKVA